MKPLEATAVRPDAESMETVTSRAPTGSPAAKAGTDTVMAATEIDEITAELFPNFTEVRPATKPDPARVTSIPPVRTPELGDTDAIVGTGRKLKFTPLEVPPALVAVT